jgi:hypothetical protein
MSGKEGAEVMESEWITVRAGGKTLECDTLILVDDRALEEEGHITMLSSNSGPQTKHEFYALSQMALIQFQDEELEVSSVEAPIKVARKNAVSEIASGMAISRTGDGELSVLAHTALPWRKLLETAHRYCTRWIRLDVR